MQILNDGFVNLIEVTPSGDKRIVEAARLTSQSAGADDRTLLRYLMRHRHSTPFEFVDFTFHVRCPMDCWRQWIRHRTACLSGDTLLHFDLPGGIERRGNQLYKLTVKDVYNRFRPTENATRPDKQGYPYFKRDRVQAMQLRCLNEETLSPAHTNIIDIWESGIKRVYAVTTEGGSRVEMSSDHLCFTSAGWKRLKDLLMLPVEGIMSAFPETVPLMAVIGPGYGTGVDIEFNTIDADTEEWRPIVDWEAYYEISSQGRVRRIVGGKGSRSFGRCKQLTVSNSRAVVSLNRPNWQETILVHREMLKAFVGPQPDGYEACHENGNSLYNDIDNLRWGTPQSNADDMVRDGATTCLRLNWDRITQVKYVGEEMTYDLEVAGPYHNFSANGMVVHNSVNEYSTRYSEAIDSCQTTSPGEWRVQSTANRQGSSGAVLDADTGAMLSDREADFQLHARKVYNDRVMAGVAKEQARKDLPLSTYTEAYWKINLHNLLHFLSLRMDAHAQFEIRQYANAIGEIIAQCVPLTWEAFVDYRLESITLTRLEVETIRKMLNAVPDFADAQPEEWRKLERCRERDECLAKLARLGL